MNKTYIPRPRYIERIAPFVGTDLIKVLVGQRRAWKSMILREIMDTLLHDRSIGPKTIIHINKEDIAWDSIRDYQDLYAAVESYSHILIDEIQDIIGWEKAIRSLQAKGGYDIYITGSNSTLLSGELATYLAGRYVSFDIFPLTYDEFLKFHGLSSQSGAFEKYLRFWGLPYLKNLPLDDEVVGGYLRDVVDTIILRDVVSRHRIRNVVFFKKLISYLAKQAGNIFSAKSISDYLKSQSEKISPNVILEYLAFSGEANFLHEVSRYDIRWKKTFELKHKFFFTDIGIKNVLAGGYNRIDISGILENVVYFHLIANGYSVKVGEFDGKEVDFVCTKGDSTIYVQVAYLLESEDTRQREFAPLLAISDHFPKYVVTLDPGASGNVDGVEWRNVEDFVLNLSKPR